MPSPTRYTIKGWVHGPHAAAAAAALLLAAAAAAAGACVSCRPCTLTCAAACQATSCSAQQPNQRTCACGGIPISLALPGHLARLRACSAAGNKTRTRSCSARRAGAIPADLARLSLPILPPALAPGPLTRQTVPPAQRHLCERGGGRAAWLRLRRGRWRLLSFIRAKRRLRDQPDRPRGLLNPRVEPGQLWVHGRATYTWV